MAHTSDDSVEARPAGVEIEAQAGRGDRMDVELGGSGAGRGIGAFPAATDDAQSVFGRIEQNMAGTAHCLRLEIGVLTTGCMSAFIATRPS